jgi:signal transduction histidine kinase
MVGSGRRWFLIDVLVCAAMFVYMLPPTLSSEEVGAGTAWDSILLPAVILPVLLRRRDPLAAAALLAAGCVVSGLPTFDQFRLGAAIPAGMLIAYSLAARTERPRALLGLALVLAGMTFISFTDVVLDDAGGPLAMLPFAVPLCIGAWGAGRAVRSREGVAEQLRERSLMLERQREETAALAVELERTRLASDLDAAARGGIRELIELASAERPEDPERTFGEIERIARDSLNELRGLLGVLRSDERGRRAPNPTLAELDTLLAEARAGGRLVDFDVEGDRRPLPPGVELAAYRAVQHALVAVRGDAGRPATVHLRYLPAAIDLEVRGGMIEGGGAAAAVAAARERVNAYGGTFSSRSDPPSLRVLRAHLPVARG